VLLVVCASDFSDNEIGSGAGACEGHLWVVASDNSGTPNAGASSAPHAPGLSPPAASLLSTGDSTETPSGLALLVHGARLSLDCSQSHQSSSRCSPPQTLSTSTAGASNAELSFCSMDWVEWAPTSDATTAAHGAAAATNENATGGASQPPLLPDLLSGNTSKHSGYGNGADRSGRGTRMAHSSGSTNSTSAAAAAETAASSAHDALSAEGALRGCWIAAAGRVRRHGLTAGAGTGTGTNSSASASSENAAEEAPHGNVDDELLLWFVPWQTLENASLRLNLRSSSNGGGGGNTDSLSNNNHNRSSPREDAPVLRALLPKDLGFYAPNVAHSFPSRSSLPVRRCLHPQLRVFGGFDYTSGLPRKLSVLIDEKQRSDALGGNYLSTFEVLFDSHKASNSSGTALPNHTSSNNCSSRGNNNHGSGASGNSSSSLIVSDARRLLGRKLGSLARVTNTRRVRLNNTRNALVGSDDTGNSAMWVQHPARPLAAALVAQHHPDTTARDSSSSSSSSISANSKSSFALLIECVSIPAAPSLVSRTDRAHGSLPSTSTSWESVPLPLAQSPLPSVKAPAAAAAVAGGGLFPLEWGTLRLRGKDNASEKEFHEDGDDEHLMREDPDRIIDGTAAAAAALVKSNAEAPSLALEQALSSAEPTVAWVDGSLSSDSALLMALAVVPPVREQQQHDFNGDIIASNEPNQFEQYGFLAVRIFRFNQSKYSSHQDHSSNSNNNASGDRDTSRDVALSYAPFDAHHQNAAAAGAGLTFRRAPSAQSALPTNGESSSLDAHLPHPPRRLPGEEYTVLLHKIARLHCIFSITFVSTK